MFCIFWIFLFHYLKITKLWKIIIRPFSRMWYQNYISKECKKIKWNANSQAEWNPLIRGESRSRLLTHHSFSLFSLLSLILFFFLFFWDEAKCRALRLSWEDKSVSMFVSAGRLAGGIKYDPSQVNWANEANPWPAECQRNE